jgi:hypothetical protein
LRSSASTKSKRPSPSKATATPANGVCDSSQAGESFNRLVHHAEQKSRYGIFIITPATGLVRMEWAIARFSQITPTNWAYQQHIRWYPPCTPLGYVVHDAQNLAVKDFIASDAEWMLSIEQDNIIPHDFFLQLNHYIRSKKVPIVSGLYFTKSYPSEPLVYRGRNNSYYTNWRIGDLVWVDAVPMGVCMIHRSILQVLWDESPEYQIGAEKTRRVFDNPEECWYNPDFGGWENAVGTSDMNLCSRIIAQKVLLKAGWPKYQKMEYPFLVDTRIFAGHIDDSGRIYPSPEERARWLPGGVGDGDPVERYHAERKKHAKQNARRQ